MTLRSGLRRLPLRARAALAVGVTSLVLSSSIALAAYFLVRSSLVNERKSVALRQAYTNARLLRSGLRAPNPDVARLLTGVQVDPRGDALLQMGDEWFTSSVNVDAGELPRSLRDGVMKGGAGRQLIRIDGVPFLVVGVHIRESDADYFELTSLADVEDSLSSLRSSLVIAAVVTTAIGVLIGIVVSGAVLRPVSRVAALAHRIAGGDLDSRLKFDRDSDLRPLAESFNEMLDELRARIQRETRFASDVTHELRGPLAALASAVQVVNRRRDELPETVVVAVDALEEQVTSFNQLVLDLLEIARFDAHAARLEHETVEVQPLLESVLHECEVRNVVVQVEPELTVPADRRRLHQVVRNLVENACRYAGGPTALIATRQAASVRIAVEDRGPGVPADERDAIFQRFARGARGEEPGAPRGTGLGLALVAEHVQLHGGTVWVEDGDDGGTRFVVELPVVGQ